MASSLTLSVRVWTTLEEFEVGVINYARDGVTIELESGAIISDKTSSKATFEVSNQISLAKSGQSVVEPMRSRLEIQLKPILVIRHPYTNLGGQVIEDIFPPSTSGFYGRLLNGENESLFFIQQVKNSKQFWLTITDPLTSRIFETQVIQPYEAEALSLVDDYRLKRIQSSKVVETDEDVLDILDSPAPSWQELSKLVEDVSIPNLQMGDTMRDTLTHIVPTSFPDQIREELMAFLAYVIQRKLPEEDPLAYMARFSSTAILESLVTGHLMHLIDKTEWPSYVKLMILAARGQLEAPKRAVSDSILSEPWQVYIHKCVELLPSWLNIAVDSVKNLNESGRVVLGLPTTKSAARKSRAHWKKRFAEISYDLMVRGYIEASALGLVELVYLGSAYRWPHRHMKFITRLGASSENPPHLQVMLMPLNAAERVRRALPSVMSVAWSARTLNLDLIDKQSNTWAIPVQQIVDSLEKKSTIRKLMNRYGGKEVSETYSMSYTDSKIADLFSEGVFLTSFEEPDFFSDLGLDKRKVRRQLKNLIKRKVINLKYELFDPNLATMALILQGKSETVTSVVAEFLRSTPTTYARLDKMGESGVLLSRLTEESVHSIASQLTSRSIDHEVTIRCMRPTTFRGYTSNLYQRLWKPNGIWDDDVSAFLSQARSKRKELSKSNA
ncbi:MAG: hypothetical protein ACFFE7_08005 [Candidatus Thorarchaeota archaeon]